MSDIYKIIAGTAENATIKTFFSNLRTNIQVENKLNGSKLDLSWIDETEKAMPYIDKIFENPKRFIISDEEIISVERTKKVTPDTVKHLAKHSNFVSDYDEETDEIVPSKLLNVFKEETFDTYENRFIYSLVDVLDDFVTLFMRKLDEMEFGKVNAFSNVATTKVNGETINMHFIVNSVKKSDVNSKTGEIATRIGKIRAAISMWRTTAVYKALKKLNIPRVSNPLKRTNVLLKNPNFKIAADLWDYIHSFNIGEDDLNDASNVIKNLPAELQRLADSSLLLSYLTMDMICNGTNYKGDIYKNYVRSVAMDMVHNTTELLMNADNTLTKEDYLDSLAKKFNEIKYKNKATNNLITDKIKEIADDYVTKLDGSYFSIEKESSNE